MFTEAKCPGPSQFTNKELKEEHVSSLFFFVSTSTTTSLCSSLRDTYSGWRNRCTACLYLAQLSVKLCGVESCTPFPFSTQPTSSPVYYRPSKWMDLNGAHQEDSTVASSGSNCRTVCASICHLFPYLCLLLWNNPPMYCLSSTNSYYLFRF